MTFTAASRRRIPPPYRLSSYAAAAAVLAAATGLHRPAHAQWNLYDSTPTSITIPYASGAMDRDNTAQIYLKMKGVDAAQFTMDTGSTGLVVTKDTYHPGNDTNLGPGSITYTSSGRIESGTYYMTEVEIRSDRDTKVAKSFVRVLLVDSITCMPNKPKCEPDPNPHGITYMGVGFDRQSAQDTTPTTQGNVFLNITSLESGAPLSSLRKGYIVENNKVTLGITTARTSDFAFVKLTPNTVVPDDKWNAAPVTVTAGGATGTGTILPDTGINYMYVTPPPGSTLVPDHRAPDGSTIKIYLPGQFAPQPANYEFTVAHPHTNPQEPDRVEVNGGTDIFVNTGREFYKGFDYIYDSEGGFVGYRWKNTPDTVGNVNAILALTGPMHLADGFSSLFPTYLYGATTFTGDGTASISGVISGPNSLTVNSGFLLLSAANTYSGGTIVNGGTLSLGAGASILDGSALQINGGTFDMGGNNQRVGALSGAGGTLLLGGGRLTAGDDTNTSFAGDILGPGSFVKRGTGTMTLTGNNFYGGGTTVEAGILAGTTSSLQGDIQNDAAVVFDQAGTGIYAGVMFGTGSLTKSGTGTVMLTGANSYAGGTFVNGGVLGGNAISLQGSIVNNAAVVFDQGTAGVYAGNMSGIGSLTKIGSDVLTLSGNNSYSGGTTVNAGTLRLGSATALPTLGVLTVNGGTFDLNGFNLSVASLSGLGGTIALGNGFLTVAEAGSTTLAAALTGTGGLNVTGTGTLNLTGVNTYTGPTTVSNGRLAVNGSITSNVTVGAGGNLGGNGTIFGSVINSGSLAPGNSIGTLNVVGSLTQNPGSIYQVEANAGAQADRINVTGAPGNATITGATVNVTAIAGTYAPSTTYTILNATGGVSGTYANAVTNYPFLQAGLTYDTNNVYLTLRPGGFAQGALTANQMAVGHVLDQSVAGSSGDFATVIGTLSTVGLQQGQATMNAISGQNYSGFSTANVASGLGFMNVLGQQMSLARGGSGSGNRTSVAMACDVACDGEPASPFSTSPFAIWGSAQGGIGSAAGNGSSATLTYNAGGMATGIDYRVDPRLLVGFGVGFASGNQWLGGFSGRGTSNSYQASLYASFTQQAFYLDAQAGYGYNDNQMTRQIAIPGLASRTAQGQAGANQAIGQAEAGYRIAIYDRAQASLTPFVRLQGMTNGQAGFTEQGAGSLNLTVAPQTTNALRTTFGAELAGFIDAGLREKVALQMRLGWAHEYADVSRPVTASFAGAPGANFTVFGAAPLRDSAVIGFAANTAIAAATQIYLRYDGEFGTGTDNHALTAGLRVSW
jgi:autotransporter-associated beta strand protein